MPHTPNGKFQYGNLYPAKCSSCLHIIWAGWTVLGNKYCHFVSIHLEVWGMLGDLGDLADHPLPSKPHLLLLLHRDRNPTTKGFLVNTYLCTVAKPYAGKSPWLLLFH